MGILAKKRVLCFVAFGLLTLISGSKVEGALGRYGLTSFKYFTPEASETPDLPGYSPEDLWCEGGILPSGGPGLRCPPGPVLDFIQAPGIDNAQRYLQWNEIKMEKLARAQQMLDELISHEYTL